MDKNVFTPDQLKAIYEVFQQVTGGLNSGWIFVSGGMVDDQQNCMIGTKVKALGPDRAWSDVWVNLRKMTEPQTEKWLELKDSIPGAVATDYTNSNNIIRLQFSVHADKVQELSPEVETDSPTDTETGG